jgi:hypothetical protein
LIVAINISGARRELVVAEAFDRIAQRVGIVAEVGIENHSLSLRKRDACEVNNANLPPREFLIIAPNGGISRAQSRTALPHRVLTTSAVAKNPIMTAKRAERRSICASIWPSSYEVNIAAIALTISD